MYEIINAFPVNPIFLTLGFLMVGGLFDFITNPVASVIGSVFGSKKSSESPPPFTDSSSAAQDSEHQATLLKLAKAKAKVKVIKAKSKTQVAKTKAKMFKNILMIGGGIILLFGIFFLARRK